MDRRSAFKNSLLLSAGLVMGPTALSLLESCKDRPREQWTPEFLDEKEANIVTTIIDTILPTTTTPGAIDVKVDIFLDTFWATTLTDDGKVEIRDAIKAMDEECFVKFNLSITDLDSSQLNDFLQSHERSSGKIGRSVWGKTVENTQPIKFYRSLKAMAIWAYTSSELIGEEVLNYDPIPGNFEACVPLDQIGRKWSL